MSDFKERLNSYIDKYHNSPHEINEVITLCQEMLAEIERLYDVLTRTHNKGLAEGVDAMTEYYGKKMIQLRAAGDALRAAMIKSVDIGTTDHLDACDDGGDFWHQAIAAYDAVRGKA